MKSHYTLPNLAKLARVTYRTVREDAKRGLLHICGTLRGARGRPGMVVTRHEAKRYAAWKNPPLLHRGAEVVSLAESQGVEKAAKTLGIAPKSVKKAISRAKRRANCAERAGK